MTLTAAAGPAPAGPLATIPEYRPGQCNIGPAEIARRRRAGHVGLLMTLAALAVLIAIDAPPLARLLVALPAAIAASGYLQAWLRFCAGFGARGVLNFGDVGSTEEVPEAVRALDRAQARRIMLASLGAGVAVGIVAALLPI
jgi:hypothetical protein